MPQQIVFPCPSCGTSLSAEEGALRVQCQFCGNTALVPEALRGPATETGAASQPGAVPAAPQRAPDYTDRMGRPCGTKRSGRLSPTPYELATGPRPSRFANRCFMGARPRRSRTLTPWRPAR